MLGNGRCSRPASLAAIGDVRCLAGNLGQGEWPESGGKPTGNFDPQATFGRPA
jgi:hypothetical protein